MMGTTRDGRDLLFKSTLPWLLTTFPIADAPHDLEGCQPGLLVPPEVVLISPSPFLSSQAQLIRSLKMTRSLSHREISSNCNRSTKSRPSQDQAHQITVVRGGLGPGAVRPVGIGRRSGQAVRRGEAPADAPSGDAKDPTVTRSTNPCLKRRTPSMALPILPGVPENE